MKYITIVSADTQLTSTIGRQYILVFRSCLYIPKMSHTLIQLCCVQTQLQNNPYATDPISILSPDGNFIACLESEGTNVFLNTWSSTQKYLALLPQIELTSQQPWEPHNISFPAKTYYVKEEMESQNISILTMNFRQLLMLVKLAQ